MDDESKATSPTRRNITFRVTQFISRVCRIPPHPTLSKAPLLSEVQPYSGMATATRPKPMRDSPLIFVWDQYDILRRKQILITSEGARREVTSAEWKTYQVPKGRLGSPWNCPLWTGPYHQLPQALDLARRVRDRWKVDVEILRNAGDARCTVFALFDQREFADACTEITDYARNAMGVIAEKQPWEVKQELTLEQMQELKGRKSFWCWNCMRGLRSHPEKESRWWRSGFEGVGSFPFGRSSIQAPGENIVLPALPMVVEWREEVPYCPACGQPLVHHAKWTGLKKWLKYPLILLLLVLILRAMGWLLS